LGVWTALPRQLRAVGLRRQSASGGGRLNLGHSGHNRRDLLRLRLRQIIGQALDPDRQVFADWDRQDVISRRGGYWPRARRFQPPLNGFGIGARLLPSFGPLYPGFDARLERERVV